MGQICILSLFFFFPFFPQAGFGNSAAFSSLCFQQMFRFGNRYPLDTNPSGKTIGPQDLPATAAGFFCPFVPHQLLGDLNSCPGPGLPFWMALVAAEPQKNHAGNACPLLLFGVCFPAMVSHSSVSWPLAWTWTFHCTLAAHSRLMFVFLVLTLALCVRSDSLPGSECGILATVLILAVLREPGSSLLWTSASTFCLSWFPLLISSSLLSLALGFWLFFLSTTSY